VQVIRPDLSQRSQITLCRPGTRPPAGLDLSSRCGFALATRSARDHCSEYRCPACWLIWRHNRIMAWRGGPSAGCSARS